MAESDYTRGDDPLPQLEDNTISPEDARRAQRDVRIELLRRLIIRGVKSPLDQQKALAQMSPSIKLTLRTIYRYRGILQKRNAIAIRKQEGLTKTVEEIAIDLRTTIEEVTRELWQTYHMPTMMIIKCPHEDHRGKFACGYESTIRSQFAQVVKVAALKEIRETTKQWTETLQSLGLSYKAPDQHQMLGADGKPIDPTAATRDQLAQDFVSFFKAKYQDPLPASKAVPEVTVERKDVTN